jgi:putrescine aminotransferase
MTTTKTTAEYQQSDAMHHLHPFTDSKDLQAHGGSRIITHAEGAYIYDSEGNQILDGMAGLWCMNLGYSRKEMAKAAAEQMEKLPYYNNFFQCTHPPSIALAEKLAEITPDNLNRVFFTGSGSESNDTVVRLVRHYWAIQGEPQKSVIISRHNAYHGSTMAGASLGGMKFMHEQGGLPLPGIVHIDQPYWYGEGGDKNPEEFGLEVAQQLEEKILQMGVDRIAAFIAEPIQGAGGVIIPPSTYWPEIQRICDKYGILLIVDEVICGFGRTGNWFGSDTYNIRPDFMPIAKGLTSGYIPMGGLMVSDRVAEVLIDKGGEIAHGFTYSGHPVAAAVALTGINIMQQENMIDHIQNTLSPYLQKRWAELADHPIVGEARGIGVLGAIELSADKVTRKSFEGNGKAGSLCRDHCINNGLVMRAVGDTMIISPPFILSNAQVDELVDKAKVALDKTADDIARGALNES